VGLDTLTHVTRNCYEALPNDERREVFNPPEVLVRLVDLKRLGSKTKQGFYKKQGDEILQIDLKTLDLSVPGERLYPLPSQPVSIDITPTLKAG